MMFFGDSRSMNNFIEGVNKDIENTKKHMDNNLEDTVKELNMLFYQKEQVQSLLDDGCYCGWISSYEGERICNEQVECMEKLMKMQEE